jgi:hypothetical protein
VPIGLVSGLIGGLGTGLDTKIEPAEALTWWENNLMSEQPDALLLVLFVGVLIGLAAGLLFGVLIGCSWCWPPGWTRSD